MSFTKSIEGMSFFPAVFHILQCFLLTTDPYVKVALMCQGKRIKKKKTSVKKNTLFPVYNEAIVFDVPQENVEEVSIVIKVIDYDRSVALS